MIVINWKVYILYYKDEEVIILELAIYFFIIILFIWFFGCVVSYKTKKWVLVDGTGINGIELKWLLIYLICCVSFIFLKSVEKWLLPIFLLIWLSIQFRCHWYYTIFGASEKKLKGYNKCFENTIHIIHISDKCLVPDLYHMVLHLLVLLLMVLCIINLF